MWLRGGRLLLHKGCGRTYQFYTVRYKTGFIGGKSISRGTVGSQAVALPQPDSRLGGQLGRRGALGLGLPLRLQHGSQRAQESWPRGVAPLVTR